MTGREKPKRKALHRGLDDIFNRDASLTSRLLGRVNPATREPLDQPSQTDVGEAGVPESVPTQPEESAGPRRFGSQSPTPAKTKTEGAVPLRRRSEAARPEGLPPSRKVDGAAEVEEGRPKGPQQHAGAHSVAGSPQVERRRVASGSAGAMSFEDFVERWGFILRSGGRTGKLRICEVLYKNTYAEGEETFFTSYEKLAKLSGLEKKQCAINVKQLETLGFIERLNIFNTATKQGTEFKLHLNQLPPGARGKPRHHYYDEDLD
jgi:hypothetical protein